MNAKKTTVQVQPVRGIRLIDTCILCEILEIPGKSNMDESKRYCKEFDAFEKAGGRFVLPLATLIETGNHIAQNGNGVQRRKAAETFVKFVQAAMNDKSPFLKSKIWEAHVAEWIRNFPDEAMRDQGSGKGKGLGDVTIQEDCEIVKQTCGVSGMPVEIWSKDKHHA